MLTCALLLVTLDVDACTGKCPGQGMIKKDVGSPGASTISP